MRVLRVTVRLYLVRRLCVSRSLFTSSRLRRGRLRSGGPGARKDFDHRAVGLGQNKDRIAAGTALQEALEANREPACRHVLVQGPADELVVTAPASRRAAHLQVADLEDLPGVVTHAPHQSGLER